MNRQQLQNSLTKFLREQELDVLTEHKGRYRLVTFCRQKITDGEVRIYGANFFLLKWKTGSQSLPPSGQEKFETLSGLKEFIKQHF